MAFFITIVVQHHLFSYSRLPFSLGLFYLELRVLTTRIILGLVTCRLLRYFPSCHIR